MCNGVFWDVIKSVFEGENMIDIEECIDELRKKRPLFISEADFQVELAWILMKKYPSAKVRCEYSPAFDPKMHIDILVIKDNKWIPIELKYKTKGCIKELDGEVYNLKNHGAKDVNCYLYNKDIERIETIRENVKVFEEGYTIFITNEISYLKPPRKINCNYAAFSLEEGIVKTGELDWGENTGTGTKKGNEAKIYLKDQYHINWELYSVIDKSGTGRFEILINRIIGKNEDI